MCYDKQKEVVILKKKIFSAPYYSVVILRMQQPGIRC